jgi:hypothetical protein
LHIFTHPGDTTGDTKTSKKLGTFHQAAYAQRMEKQGIWLAFDLGVRGDYESLYKWLDARQAKECGENVAYVQFEYEKNLLDDLTTSLQSNVKMTGASRFYVIGRWKEDLKIRGRFIIGNRKPPPWTGFGPQKDVAQSDEA